MFSRPPAIGVQGPPAVGLNESEIGRAASILSSACQEMINWPASAFDALLGRNDPGGRLGQIDADPEVGLVAARRRLAAQARAVGHHDAETIESLVVDVDAQAGCGCRCSTV